MLARRLLETGQVESVHIYGNIVTVDLRKGYTGDSLEPIIEDLYIYYRPGFVPPPLEMPAEETPAAGGGGEDAVSTRRPPGLGGVGDRRGGTSARDAQLCAVRVAARSGLGRQRERAILVRGDDAGIHRSRGR